MVYKHINNLNDIPTSYVNDEDKELRVIIDLDNYHKEDIHFIVDKFNILKENGYLPSLAIYGEYRNFTDEEIATFVFYEDYLKKAGYPLYIDGGYKADYSLEDLMLADKKLDEIIETINGLNLSPLERFLYIYDYLTDKVYTAPKDDEEKVHLSRDIIAIMNNNYIVCSGYAALLKHLCDNVGIKCMIQNVTVGTERHNNNLVFIDDDKYDVHGLYYVDTTWDSYKPNRYYTKTLSHCLIPLNDIAYYKLSKIYPDSSFLIFYKNHNDKVICDPEDRELSFIGKNRNLSLPFDYSYVPGLTETELGLEKEVKDSYKEALELFLSYRKETCEKLINLFKKYDVKENIYDFQCPSGTSLAYMFAVLTTLNEVDDFVERRVQQLLKYKEQNTTYEFQPYDVYFRINDVYKVLEAVSKTEEDKINLSDEEFQRIIVDNINHQIDTTDYVEYNRIRLEKEVYDLIYNIIYRMRHLLVYPNALEVVKEKYYQGEPIDINKFKTALKTVYISKNLKEKAIDNKVDEIIFKSFIVSNLSFSKKANSKFIIEDETPLYLKLLDKSKLVHKYEQDDVLIKIYTDILLGKSNDYLNLYLVFEEGNWYLTDSNNIYMILDDYYSINEKSFNEAAKKCHLVNENYRLHVVTNLYNLETHLKHFQHFVESIISK